MKKLLIVLILILLQSCVTYQKCKDKFATTYQDTLTYKNEVTVSVPKDSILISYINDTIPFYLEAVQGRAKLSIHKTPFSTSIKADCDSITKTETKYIKVTTSINNYGVTPNWKYAFYVLLGILTFALLYIVINKIILQGKK